MFALTRWSPFGTAFQLDRELDDLLSRFLDEAWPSMGREEAAAASWLPAVESYAKDGTLHVRAALPGVDPKDVEVTITDNLLTLKGERKSRTESKDVGYFRRELAHGSFERTLTLPEGVDPGKVQARYANGMLELSMPVPRSLAPKRIEIQIESGESQPKAIKAA